MDRPPDGHRRGAAARRHGAHAVGGDLQPSRGDQWAVETGDVDVQPTFHDDLFPNTGNIPPQFSFFDHLVFEDVQIEVLQADPPEAQ